MPTTFAIPPRTIFNNRLPYVPDPTRRPRASSLSSTLWASPVQPLVPCHPQPEVFTPTTERASAKWFLHSYRRTTPTTEHASAKWSRHHHGPCRSPSHQVYGVWSTPAIAPRMRRMQLQRSLAKNFWIAAEASSVSRRYTKMVRCFSGVCTKFHKSTSYFPYRTSHRNHREG
jgi:hypothetical protein